MTRDRLAEVGRRRLLIGASQFCLCTTLAWAAPQGASAAPEAARPPRLLVLGDSLSAEYGLARGSGWVALLARRLEAEKKSFEVVNASVSGETTSGGLSRLPALLKLHQPSVVVVELGANDALRGLPLRNTQDNLDAIVRAAQLAKARVLLLGMQVPPNYGPQYTRDFAALFSQVARARGAPLVPFLLHDVADRPDAESWFQADRIHPKAEAHPTLLNNVWPQLLPLLATPR